MTKVTTVRLDDELATKLDQLAASLERPKTWLIEQAISRYVEEQSWQIEAITSALHEYRSGKAQLIPHDEVMDRMEAKIKARLSE